METRDICSETQKDSMGESGIKIFEFKTDSKWLKYYHGISIISCFLILIVGIVLSFNVSNEYFAYEYFSGGYYERNVAVLIAGIITSIVASVLELVVCKVLCEFFDNVNSIRKALQKKGE